MTVQYSIAVRNAKLAAFMEAVGPFAVLRIYEGTMPLTTGDPDAAVLIASLDLPEVYMDEPDTGIVDKLGSWHTDAALADGTASYFRVWESTATTCHMQGTITELGLDGDLQLDNTDFNAGQAFTISAWEVLAGNA